MSSNIARWRLKKTRAIARTSTPGACCTSTAGIVATRTHDLETMKQAFDEFLIYLPQEAPGFFAEGMKEMDALDYPPHVRRVMEFYFNQNPSISVH
jgi:hypothetical protein